MIKAKILNSIVFMCLTAALFSSCSKKSSPTEETSKSIQVEKNSHTFFYFSDGAFKKVDKPNFAPQIPFKPWTEATRISAISCAEKPDETNGNPPKAFAIVNRLGIISMNDTKFDLFVDSDFFNGRTAGNLVFYSDFPVYSIYRSTFFNDMERNFKTHPFLVRFNPEQNISFPIINVENLKLNSNSEITDYIWDGKTWTCCSKTTDDGRIDFNYLSFQIKENLQYISPENADEKILINPQSMENYRDETRPGLFENAPERLKTILKSLSKSNFLITVYTAGGHSPRKFVNGSTSDEENILSAQAILAENWICTLFQDGTIFLKGALYDRPILNGGKTVVLKLPKLQAGFIYSGFAISGTTLYAAWEETAFYKTARSGFLQAELDNLIY